MNSYIKIMLKNKKLTILYVQPEIYEFVREYVRLSEYNSWVSKYTTKIDKLLPNHIRINLDELVKFNFETSKFTGIVIDKD